VALRSKVIESDQFRSLSIKLLNSCMKINEIKPQKPLTPDQARIKSLRDRVKQGQAAVRAERARQTIKKGQENLNKAISS